MVTMIWRIRATFGLLAAVVGLGLAFWLSIFGSSVFAQNILPKSAEAIANIEFGNVQFVGPFGAEDERNPKQDTFTFKDGKFVTGSCLEWGFSPAPYWLRQDATGLRFLAELESPEHGTMRYEGVFDGEKLSVVAYWKKERWYWTTERTYRGYGNLATPKQ